MSENIIYGFHAVNACLQRQHEQIQLIVIDGSREDARMKELLQTSRRLGVKVEEQTRYELEVICSSRHHQGIVAVMKSGPPQDLEQFLDTVDAPFLLILDSIQDPHNLGACLRTANAAGVHAVIAPKDRACGITSVVSKVASGAAVFTPFFQVTNLARTLEKLKARGIWLYGASERGSQLYAEVNYSRSLAIVMGAEGKGLRRLTEESCDFLIRIPMLGAVSSLNVSVATGICLYEIVRQRQGEHSRQD